MTPLRLVGKQNIQCRSCIQLPPTYRYQSSVSGFIQVTHVIVQKKIVPLSPELVLLRSPNRTKPLHHSPRRTGLSTACSPGIPVCCPVLLHFQGGFPHHSCSASPLSPLLSPTPHSPSPYKRLLASSPVSSHVPLPSILFYRAAPSRLVSSVRFSAALIAPVSPLLPPMRYGNVIGRISRCRGPPRRQDLESDR